MSDIVPAGAMSREPARPEASFVGRGFFWPLQVDHTGSIRLTDGAADLDAATAADVTRGLLAAHRAGAGLIVATHDPALVAAIGRGTLAGTPQDFSQRTYYALDRRPAAAARGA